MGRDGAVVAFLALLRGCEPRRRYTAMLLAMMSTRHGARASGGRGEVALDRKRNVLWE